jgi:hypothetical protein
VPNVLTTTSTVGCGHLPPPPGSGVVQVQSTAKLRVAGAPVLLLGSIANKPLVPLTCGIVVSQTNVKCTKVAAVTAGTATKLTVGGQPVVLDTTLKGSTDGTLGGVTPQLLLAAVANQTKLTSV